MLQIVHLFWHPEAENATRFVQGGYFCLWLETRQRGRTGCTDRQHPGHVPTTKLVKWLKDTLGVAVDPANDIVHPCLTLPSDGDRPLPSPEWLLANGEEYPDQAVWKDWIITACRLPDKPIHLINDLHFRLLLERGDTQAGQDFLFWLYFTQSIRNLLLKDQYVPFLHHSPAPKKKEHELYTGWAFMPASLDSLLTEAVGIMPPAAAPGLDAESALRHAAEVLLHQIAGALVLTKAMESKLGEGFIAQACRSRASPLWQTTTNLTVYRQWHLWYQAVAASTHSMTGFVPGLKLEEAPPGQDEAWHLSFEVFSHRDPSLHWSLSDYWPLPQHARDSLTRNFGEDFERELLCALGQAARIYPLLWQGMQTAEPTGMTLTLEQAFAFLTEMAWLLEEAGFRVSVPAWWTPQGRRRAKLRMRKAGTSSKPARANRKSRLDLEELSAYRYDLTLDGEILDPAEWAELVANKTPLVRFRGQWVTLDREKMQEMLTFWKQQQEDDTPSPLSMQEVLRRAAEEPDDFEIDPSLSLAELLEKLRDPGRIESVPEPAGLQATLRDYQKRGVAWLAFLERLGLAGCLADDMGLGKTIQVITHLLREKATAPSRRPSLLIAPTSVLGNWRKEIERFAPTITTLLHHGSSRNKDKETFMASLAGIDLVLVSYSLALRDEKLLTALSWQRIVLDEAQNIKNPEALQTKAIVKLRAEYRLALTGTPVENRLLDLWSIFNFLNPGYLGRQTHFRKHYETPIQRDHDAQRSLTLKRLTEPFILRRVKTDPAIIRDLPDKVENRQYCNLSREQASLYEAVARDVATQLEEKDGLARQGLILSTLMKLKQICNHPAQFLQDGSAFEASRSHKLQRLIDLLREVRGAGESALVFTQFTEVGNALKRCLEMELQTTTYYLHGGTPRARREQMVEQFQNPDTPAAVFILSLKAGGVGITLTRANHVFHFDRWWNPAVEDQATDRAFRIGQLRNVFVHKFVTLGTLEERIDQMIEDKRKVAGSIIAADESWLAQLDNETFKQLIALNRATILED